MWKTSLSRTFIVQLSDLVKQQELDRCISDIPTPLSLFLLSILVLNTKTGRSWRRGPNATYEYTLLRHRWHNSTMGDSHQRAYLVADIRNGKIASTTIVDFKPIHVFTFSASLLLHPVTLSLARLLRALNSTSHSVHTCWTIL